MSYYLVNETLAVVEQEIDQFLTEFPSSHPFVMALSLPHFRQQLKSKILSKIPNRHRIRTEQTPDLLPPNRFTGILKERLIIEEKIRQVMPEMIDNVKNHSPQHQLEAIINQGNETNGTNQGTDWWLKIHTIIPCVTYYFGPFTTKNEARTACPGYLEDLKGEKAIGIFADFHQGCPDNLTVEDSPADLKQDQQRLWKSYKKIYQQKSALEASHHRLLDLLPGNYLIIDCLGKIQEANQNACRLLNTDLESLRGDAFIYYVPQQQILLFEDHLERIILDQDGWKVPYRWSMQIQTSNIIPINVDIQVTPKRDEEGTIVGFYFLLNDTTSLKTINDQLYYDSRRDTLTRIPNRRCFDDYWEEFPHNSQSKQYQGDQLFALLMLDLNKFKKINDRFGHLFGEKVLQRVEENLWKCVNAGDRVARIDEDKFVIVLKSIQSVEEAKECAYRIHRVFSLPLVLEERQLSISVTIGIVTGSGGQFDYDRLVHSADIAVDEAKGNGMLFAIFDDKQPSSNGKSCPMPVRNLSLGGEV